MGHHTEKTESDAPLSQSDNAVLDSIIRDNSNRIQSFVRSRVHNRADADDIVQDTFYRLTRSFSLIDNPIAEVTSWLYTVARNLIINHGKKRREEELVQGKGYSNSDWGNNEDGDTYMRELSDVMIASHNDSPEMQILRNMVWDELEEALKALPPEQRRAIEMTEIEGLSVKDAAQAMGVSLGTMLSRKHYATQKIRQRLRVLYDELTKT